jgi:hypothetical protein
MPERTKGRERPDPGTITGRIKQSIGQIREHFAGKGARVRQDKYDRVADEAEIGRRRSNQSTDDDN